MSRQNLSRNFSRRILAVVVLTWMTGGTAFGWAGRTHSALTHRVFDIPVVAQFLGQVDQGTIEDYKGEPSQTSHDVQWELISQRKYLSSGGACSNGFWLWCFNNETTRLQYLTHHLGDVGVPAHHFPAGEVFDNKAAEGYSEAAAAVGYTFVGELPYVNNTTSYTHSQNGYSCSFTGTICDVLSTYRNACINNANYYRGGWLSRVASANWNALTLDLMLQRAVLVDYFLAKRNAVALPSASYDAQTDLVTFYGGNSYDTDDITWNANGTYTYADAGVGISQYAWDFNNDGNFDHFSDNPSISIYDWYLVYLGCTLNAWNTYAFSVMDDEGKWSEAPGYFYLPGGAVPEPATLSLILTGSLGLAIRRKK